MPITSILIAEICQNVHEADIDELSNGLKFLEVGPPGTGSMVIAISTQTRIRVEGQEHWEMEDYANWGN